jgi:polyhydroxyalkanoate synthesis regulator phasin
VPEELETILRLVAEGRLSPEEAGPIIEALTRAERVADEPLDRHVERHVRRAERHAERAGRRFDEALDRADRELADATERVSPRGRQLRIRVTERGRQVVNLRIPIGFVDRALQFVPGLAGDQAQRIRDAVRAGTIGPLLDVEDPDGQGGVLISVE